MKKGMKLFVLLLMSACTSQTEGDKHQNSREKVVDVKSEIKEIDTGDVLIGNSSNTYLSKDYLIITDYQAYDKVVHVFNKADFHHLASFGTKGQGPYEITNMGHLITDEVRRKFYISDNSKYKIFSYDIDSVLAMPESYQQQIKMNIKRDQIPSDFHYVNDTLCYGRIILPTSASTFDQHIGKWNMTTGDIKIIGEKHPEVHNKRTHLAVSMEKKMLVEAYYNYDLMNISDLDGNIQCYIYGPNWPTKGLETFGKPLITPQNILVPYSGETWATAKTRQIHIFDLKGNYEKTLNIGYDITHCCYDEQHHRLIFSFNDDIQFGYLDLKGII